MLPAMSRTVLLVGGPGHHRRAVREALRYEGVAAMEAEGAQPALALLREAAFDVVVVSDEPRRLALQGLFAQLRRAQPVPAMFLLPLPEGDKVALRSMAGPESRLLDPNISPQALAHTVVDALGPAAAPAPPAWEHGPALEKGRALDLYVAERRGSPPAFLAEPSAALRGDVDFGAELMRGAALAAKLSHPNLPQVLDHGDAEHPFVASAYEPGITLERLLKRLGAVDHAFSYSGAMALIAEVLSALEAIHDAKLIHGALAPRTLWITDEGHVLVLHAGISRHVYLTERGMRGAGLLPMKLEYETPESVTDGTLDSKSDLFTAGVVLWELLASERLFARSDQMTTLDAIRDAEIAPLPGAVPAGYRAFVEHLLARDPDARPRSAAAARAELNLALKQPNNGKVQSGVFGRLFGKRGPEAAAAKRLSIADPRAERAQLVALAMR